MHTRTVIPDHTGNLVITKEKLPPPEHHQVLIAVKAAGINRADLLQRRGKYPPPKGAPLGLGLEVAGTIVALGAGVTGWKKGDRVMALVAGGGYADYCLADSALCFPCPSPLSFEEAAALPEACFTVWNSLYGRDLIRPQERLLIHGGSSGIGTIAIQIARLFDNPVAVTVKNQQKAEACLALGCDKAILYPVVDFVDEVLSWTNQRGVDVILDCVGGSYTPRNIKALAFRGRLVNIACQGGALAELPLVPVMVQQLLITGATLRDRPRAEKTLLAKGITRHLLPALEEGRLKPVIHKILPFSEMETAHQMLSSGKHIGKIVLSLVT